MQLIHKANFYALKAEDDGVAILTFYKGKDIKSVHATHVSRGWNLLDDLNTNYAKADSVKMLLFKTGIVPGNISSGLGGSPIIPLSEAVSDQKELGADEDDIQGELEPDHDVEKPPKNVQISIIENQPSMRDRKSSDPFLFSESARQLLPKK